MATPVGDEDKARADRFRSDVLNLQAYADGLSGALTEECYKNDDHENCRQRGNGWVCVCKCHDKYEVDQSWRFSAS